METQLKVYHCRHAWYFETIEFDQRVSRCLNLLVSRHPQDIFNSVDVDRKHKIIAKGMKWVLRIKIRVPLGRFVNIKHISNVQCLWGLIFNLVRYLVFNTLSKPPTILRIQRDLHSFEPHFLARDYLREVLVKGIIKLIDIHSEGVLAQEMLLDIFTFILCEFRVVRETAVLD